ncbi:MAG: phosphatase PAP2 family protein [Rhodoferax sp.]|nr:phosphatase PAP2 family protein [Rhodoferax sp.]
MFAALIALWDLSALDLPLARLSGGPSGFALREHWLFTIVLHDSARRVAWALALLLCAAVWFPVGWLRRVMFHRRVQLALTALVAVAAISALKSVSRTSCPWSLADFGGVAHYVPHWSNLLVADGGNGRCFPAGHASSGFSFFGGYFALRRDMPELAVKWLIATLAVGMVLGIAQQVRGAHFMSHTLWTGWICWCAAWAIDAFISRLTTLGVAPNLAQST